MGRKFFLCIMAVPFLSACAAFQVSAAPLTPRQASALEATCSRIMRLDKGEAEFEGCVSSLSDALGQEIQEARAMASYRDCNQAGLKRGTPDFSRCVLESEEAHADVQGPVTQLDAAYVKPSDTNPDGYFSTSFALRHQREQYACAQIGLAPDSGPFTSCVADLDGNLFYIEHPPA